MNVSIFSRFEYAKRVGRKTKPISNEKLYEREPSETAKAHSTGEDARSLGCLVCNLLYPRVNKKKHSCGKDISLLFVGVK
jgi:hypothetical protein